MPKRTGLRGLRDQKALAYAARTSTWTHYAMNLGMKKSEAEKRIRGGEYTWQQLAKLLKDVAPIVRPIQGQSSKHAKGVPLAILFQVYARAANRLKGIPEGAKEENIAIELLREFGTPKKAKPPKRRK
jgi:hypothetical protein